MPIIAGSSGTPGGPTTPPPTDGPPPVPTGRPVQYPQIPLPRNTFIWETDDDIIVLTGGMHGYETPSGWKNDEMSDLELNETSGIDDGAFISSISIPPRRLFVPVKVSGRTWAELDTRMDRLINALAPVSWSGIEELPPTGLLTIQRPNGRVRTGAAYYENGAQGATGRGVSGQWFRNLGITFMMPDPFPYDPREVLVEWRDSSPRRFFPILPLRLQTEQVSGQPFNVQNTGPIATWPSWRVRGAGGVFRAKNLTTGREFWITGSLSATDLLEIRIERGWTSVTVNGVNAYSRLRGQLWSLPRRTSQVQVTLEENQPGHEITMSYLSRHWRF